MYVCACVWLALDELRITSGTSAFDVCTFHIGNEAKNFHAALMMSPLQNIDFYLLLRCRCCRRRCGSNTSVQCGTLFLFVRRRSLAPKNNFIVTKAVRITENIKYSFI